MLPSAPEAGGGRTEHLAALDGLRGIAAVAVAIRHSLNAIPMSGELRRQLFESPLALLLSAQGAVQLFFVLSGWVLAAALARRSGGVAAWPAFWVRRVFRIHPPFVFAVLFAWALTGVTLASNEHITPWIARFADERPSTGAVLRSLAFPGIGAGLLPVGWTLTIEMLYSFALPLLVLAARPARGLVLLAAAGLALTSSSPLGWYGFDFALGVVAFQERDAIARALGRAPAAVRALVPAAGALLFAAPVAFFPKQERLGVLVNANDAAEVAVMSVGSVLLVASAVALPGFGRAVGAAPFAFLGRISYSIYLLHHALVTVLAARILTGAAPLLEGLALIGVVVVGSILLAVATHRFVEEPAIGAGRNVARAVERWLAPRSAT